MLATELVRKINFNDSCVNKLIYTNETVTLNIDLCMWKQKGYKDGDPELKKVDVIFFDVTNYIWDSSKSEEDLDYDTIIEIKAEGNKIEIILIHEEPLKVSRVSILSFKCTKVQLNLD